MAGTAKPAASGMPAQCGVAGGETAVRRPAARPGWQPSRLQAIVPAVASRRSARRHAERGQQAPRPRRGRGGSAGAGRRRRRPGRRTSRCPRQVRADPAACAHPAVMAQDAVGLGWRRRRQRGRPARNRHARCLSGRRLARGAAGRRRYAGHRRASPGRGAPADPARRTRPPAAWPKTMPRICPEM